MVIRTAKKLFKYTYNNLLLPRLLSFKNREVLAVNRTIKGKYTGKRCFVIGSGPSVKEIDLNKFKDEYTFVCAQFDRHPQFKSLEPSFYILSDSSYFTEREGNNYWPEQFKLKDKTIDKNTTIFVDLKAKDFIEKYSMFRNHQYYYCGTQGIFSENLPLNINLDKYTPWPKNSVLQCLMIAVYLGFTEIYIMGCEHNFLNYNIGLGKAAAFEHSYEDEISKADISNDEVMKKFLIPREQYMTYEGNVAHVFQLFKNYRFFYSKVRKAHPNTKIYNTTPNSFLDVFPHIDLEKVKF
jgi:hypothetical protein